MHLQKADQEDGRAENDDEKGERAESASREPEPGSGPVAALGAAEGAAEDTGAVR